eukprot:233824-Alexandrium_andersonii.AAC.1
MADVIAKGRLRAKSEFLGRGALCVRAAKMSQLWGRKLLPEGDGEVSAHEQLAASAIKRCNRL